MSKNHMYIRHICVMIGTPIIRPLVRITYIKASVSTLADVIQLATQQEVDIVLEQLKLS